MMLVYRRVPPKILPSFAAFLCENHHTRHHQAPNFLVTDPNFVSVVEGRIDNSTHLLNQLAQDVSRTPKESLNPTSSNKFGDSWGA